MNFIEAVKLLVEEDKKDIRVFLVRKAWNKSYPNPYRIYINDKKQLVKWYLNENPMEYNYGEYEEDIYSASPNAILADDWKIVKTEPIERLYNFDEAMEAFKKNKGIKRKRETEFRYKGLTTTYQDTTKFCLSDYEAKDWIIENEITGETAYSKELCDLIKESEGT